MKKRLEKHGIGLTLASGRNIYLMKDILASLEIALPFITDNGGNLYQNQQRLINNVLPDQRTKEVSSFLYARQIPFMVYTDRAVYTNCLTEPLEIFANRLKNKMAVLQYRDDHNYSEEPSFKITVDSAGLNQFQKTIESFDLLFPDVCFHQSEGALYTITSLLANKGSALQQLTEILRIPLDEVIVFGDNHNDISMFKTAGCCVAVKNAEPDALAEADDICESNNQNGVSRYLQNYLESNACKSPEK